MICSMSLAEQLRLDSHSAVLTQHEYELNFVRKTVDHDLAKRSTLAVEMAINQLIDSFEHPKHVAQAKTSTPPVPLHEQQGEQP